VPFVAKTVNDKIENGVLIFKNIIFAGALECLMKLPLKLFGNSNCYAYTLY